MILPETLESIKVYAFDGCTSLESITIPGSVKTIASYAFSACTGLQSVVLTEGLETIDSNAFKDSTGMTGIEIPDSVTAINTSAFEGCSGLKSVKLSAGLTAISERAFKNCSGLLGITVPAGVTTIYNSAFEGCTSLKDVTLPDTLTTIRAYAFNGCTGLESIDIPDSVTTISGRAFYGCTKLSEVGYPSGWTATPDYYYNSTTSVSDGNGYYRSPFEGCTSLKEITVDEGVTSIPKHAFRYQTSIERVILPETLESIKVYAFDSCTALKEIWIPSSVTVINNYVFRDCSALTIHGIEGSYAQTYAQENNIPFSTESIIKETAEISGSVKDENGSPISGVTVSFYNVTEERTESKTAVTDETGNWTYTKAIVGNRYSISFTHEEYIFNAHQSIKVERNGNTLETVIGQKLAGFEETPAEDFTYTVLNGSYCSIAGYTGSSADVMIPSELNGYIVQTISSKAFENNKTLQRILIPGTVETIGDNAFKGCTNLSFVSVSRGLATIYNSAFEGCTSLKDVTLPDTLTTIRAYAFNGCTGLESIDIPDSVTTISGRAFYGCTKLSEVGYPSGWTATPDYYYNSTTSVSDGNGYYRSPFEGCTSLKEITVDEGVTSIPKHAFRYQTSIERVILPETLESIKVYAFDGCNNLRKINLPEGITEISSYTFRDCTGLSELNLPDSIITIRSYAFYGCSGFRLLNLDANLETIEQYAFYGCNGLVSLVLNDGLETLSDHSFANCRNLETVSVPESVTTVHSKCFDSCPKLVLYCYSGSAAHYAAEQNGYNFVLLDEHEHQFEDTTETSASCTHEGSVIRTCSTCGYHYIVLTNPLGHDYQDIVVEPTCTKEGYIKHRCSRCDDEYKSDYTSPLGHAFGDWVQDAVPTPIKEGSKHRTCTRCGEVQEEIIPKADLNEDYGLVNFTIVNAQTLEPVNHAQIQVETESDGKLIAGTDGTGKTSMVLPVGTHTALIYASGCQTRSVKFSVVSGETDLPQIGISDKPLYDATITSHLMTYEEIIEAGIDPSAAENNHLYKYELKLEFVPEIDWMSIYYYMDDNGNKLGGGGTHHDPGDPGDPNPLTPDAWVRPIYWICDDIGSGGSGGSGSGKGHFHIPATSTHSEINIYPVSEYFYLIIRGEVRWLKEMFDVEMVVVNNSMTDTMEDLTATLDLPEGLSLATMVSEQQKLTQELGTIEGGGFKSVHWYVRGDTAGSYNVSARLQGRLMPFNEVIDDLFVGDNAIQVWAGNALHLHFEFPNAAYYGEDYPITITLENVSDITLYNVNHKIQIVQGMEYYYADGSSKKKIETSDWYDSGTLREFHPGDKIIMEADVNIFFVSEKIQAQIQNMINQVSGMERYIKGMNQVMNAYNAVQIGINAANSLVSCVSSCSNAISNFDFTASTESEAKLELFRQLHNNISDLYSSYSSSGNKTLDAALKLANSGMKASLNAIANDPGEWLKNHSEDDIKDLLKKTSALTQSIRSSSPDDFDIYDSIRTAISSIPVRFVLTNVIMTEDENNTTSIPWSYSVKPTSAHYFGVSSVSRYLMAFAQIVMADAYEDAMPNYMKLIPGLDDPFNREEAIRYIQATEEEISFVKAKDATGNVTFRCWIERSSGAKGTLDSSGFILNCDNETAVVENGVLTFTGDGMIELTPVSGENGTLHIEDSEGNRYEYEVNVSPPHECHAGGIEIIVDPSDEYDGFGVRRCDICGEIMEIETVKEESLCEEHTFTEWVVETEPTDEDEGVRVRTCTVCGKKEYDFFSDGTTHTHSVSTWTTVTEPTCQSEGERTGICDICGETVTETIAKTEHIPGEAVRENEIAPTFDTEGSYDEVIYCTVCGEELSRNTMIVDRLSQDDNYVYTSSGSAITITKYIGTDTEVVIPSVIDDLPVTAIGPDAFSQLTGITSVTIPDSVTEICEYAFENCRDLTHVLIPADVKTIGNRIFGSCSNLITAGPIGSGANIEFGWTAEIPARAFNNCTHLTDITIPDSITTIGEYAFLYCSGLKNITIPASITNIGTNVFLGCTGLKTAGPVGSSSNIEFGWTTAIPARAFNGTDSLIAAVLPDTVTSIGHSVFANCSSLTDVTLSANLTAISYQTFINCRSLTSISIPDSVTLIDAFAFYNCTGLTGITIPDNVTSVGAQAFDGCISLVKVIIPASVTEPEHSIFRGCTGLQTAGPVGSGANIEFGWTESIPSNAFNYCSSLTDVSIPETVTSIGTQAFYNCTGLTAITIPESVTSIGRDAFKNCISLTEVTIPSSVTNIGSRAFGYKKSDEAIEGFTIYGYRNTAAQEYADQHGFTFVKLRMTLPEGCVLDIDPIPYIGWPMEPVFTVTVNGEDLIEGIDYTLSYENNLNVGTATAIVTGIGDFEGSVTKEFTIIPFEMEPGITLTPDEFIYDGTEKIPEVIVKDTGIDRVLTEDVDYTLTYDEGRINAGIYTVYVEMKGNYAGNGRNAFMIVPKEITPEVTFAEDTITYDGTQKTPEVIVKDGETVLTKGTDYTVSYGAGRINAGTYNATVTLKGNYKGSGTASFTITPKAITPAVTLTTSSYTYDGSAKTPGVTVKDGDVKLVKDTDYQLTYTSGRKNAGTYNIKVTLMGNYSGSKKVSFTINPKAVTPEVTLDKTSYVYDGSAKTPGITVSSSETVFTEGTDYEIGYPAGMINAGTYTINVNMIGNYTGSGSASYTITKAAQKLTVKSSAEMIAVGKTASITVTGAKGKITYTSDDTDVAEVSEDGTITANAVGTAVISVVSAATKNYKKKTVKLTISVVPGATTKIAAANKAGGIKVAWKAVTGATGYYIYRNGKLAKTITSGSTTSWGDTKATSNCTKYTYKVVAYADTGKSTLSKSLTTYFITRPAISSLTNSAAGKATVKWDKNTEATGYQVQYSTSSTFDSYKTVTIRSNTTVSKAIGSLTKGKTYYVRVRSFLTVNSKNYYSMWSVVKKLSITK